MMVSKVHLPLALQGESDLLTTVPSQSIRDALAFVLDSENWPLLMHCNKGKVRLHILPTDFADYVSAASHGMCRWLSAQAAKLVNGRSRGRIQALLFSKIASGRPTLYRLVQLSASLGCIGSDREETGLVGGVSDTREYAHSREYTDRGSIEGRKEHLVAHSTDFHHIIDMLS